MLIKHLLKPKRESVSIAFCPAHTRRDFLTLAKGYPQQEPWALEWVEAIGELYYFNDHRSEALENEALENEALENQCGNEIDTLRAEFQLLDKKEKMERQCNEQLAQPKIHLAIKKVLESLKAHWEGLTLFVENPDIPMDNNLVENALRGPVLGRKGYHGSGASFTGYLAAMMFTILQERYLATDINPRLWLEAYLQAVALGGGQPPTDIDEFLPWKMSDEQRQAYSWNKLDENFFDSS